jgi:sortase A
MKLDRKWRGWRVVERVALWATFLTCSFVASQPLRERWSAWQSQRVLEARWQQALQQEKTKEQAQSKATASPRRSKAKPRPVSGHISKVSSAKPKEQPTATPTAEPTERPTQEPENSQIMWPITRLTCSRMKLDAVVVQGTDASQLKQGPGHETDTSLPGGPNCVVAAHRNAYGWWFYRLNELQTGDFVVLQVPGRKFIYRVAVSRVVSVNDTSILHSRAKAAPRLTLYSCTLPKTEKRLVVIANLANSEAT